MNWCDGATGKKLQRGPHPQKVAVGLEQKRKRDRGLGHLPSIEGPECHWAFNRRSSW